MEMSFSVENMNPEKFCHQVCKFFGSVALPSINLQLLQTFVQCMYAIMKNYFINSSFLRSLVVISVHPRLNKMELLQSQAPVGQELSGSSASARHGTFDIGL